jgi:hypothetical protein
MHATCPVHLILLIRAAVPVSIGLRVTITDFPRTHQANAGIIPWNRPRQSPKLYLINIHNHFSNSFDVIQPLQLKDNWYQVLTAASMKMTVFWVVAPRSLLEVYWRFRCACYVHHQGASGHLWNVDKRLPDYTAQQPKRQLCQR